MHNRDTKKYTMRWQAQVTSVDCLSAARYVALCRVAPFFYVSARRRSVPLIRAALSCCVDARPCCSDVILDTALLSTPQCSTSRLRRSSDSIYAAKEEKVKTKE